MESTISKAGFIKLDNINVLHDFSLLAGGA